MLIGIRLLKKFKLSFHIMTISVLHLLANDIYLILLNRHPEIANKNTKY